MRIRNGGFKSVEYNVYPALVHAMWLTLLLCSWQVQAGAFDDFTKSVTQSVSEAARKSVDSVTQGVSSAVGKATAPAAETTPVSAPDAVQDAKPMQPLAPDKLDKGAKAFYEHCAIKSPDVRGVHDCTCLTEGYRQKIAQSGKAQLSFKDENQLMQTCPASQETIEASVYKACDATVKTGRSDHVALCTCTAQHFATEFRAHPDSTTGKVDWLRRKSMLACGVADQSHNVR